MLASALTAILCAYSAAGLLFAVAFAAAGVNRLDPAAKHAGWGFRAFILPGSAALWPLLLWKWLRAHR
jgi:hypothetical protein